MQDPQRSSRIRSLAEVGPPRCWRPGDGSTPFQTIPRTGSNRHLSNPGHATPPGRFKTPEDFDARWRELDPDGELGLDLEVEGGDPLAAPFDVVGPDGRPRRIGNRFAVHPMEGWDGTEDGAPSEDTLRRWRRFGESGAKLIWGGEAYAVQPDGRANPNQLHLNPGRCGQPRPPASLLETLKARAR